MRTKPEVYFGACDRQMEQFVSSSDFLNALVYGIMFQGDLVVVDIFFYISTHLQHYLLDTPLGRNFITAGVRSGAIIPVFRREGTESFQQNLDEIEALGIQGLHERVREIAKLLDEALVGSRLYSKIWPKEPVSVGYRQTLERALLSSNILDSYPELESIWKETKNVREQVISGLPTDELGGARRGDVYNAIQLYYGQTQNRINDVRDVWRGLTDPGVWLQSQTLVKWSNYCYYYNQGRMFGLNPWFSALGSIDIPFVRHLAELSDGHEEAQAIHQEYRVPSADAMLTIDPPFLFEVRDSMIGERYFSRVAEWRRAPTENTANALSDALRAYIAAINRVYLARGRSRFNWQWHLKAHIPQSRGRWGSFGVDSLRDIATEALGQVVPHIGLASIVGECAAITYETLPASLRDKLGPPLGIKTRQRIEFQKRLEFVKNQDTATTEASISFRQPAA